MKKLLHRFAEEIADLLRELLGEGEVVSAREYAHFLSNFLTCFGPSLLEERRLDERELAKLKAFLESPLAAAIGISPTIRETLAGGL